MTWEGLVDEGIVTNTDVELENMSPANFRIAVDGVDILFEIDFQGYNGDCASINNCISISGQCMSRALQEDWRKIVIERVKGVAEAGGDFPLYQLLSSHLLPLLHEAKSKNDTSNTTSAEEQRIQVLPSTTYHVLFTSHHFISTTKRQNLSGWSSQLGISGFAKIGYPGLIYAEGSQDSIEEFADNIKAMQWLALKKRFIEPLESTTCDRDHQLSGWKEFEKVGEVVKEMRRLGRGEYVLEMGIGAGAKE
ncbi:hypothetical protein AGABI2DRAFT_175617 [Agaricus bisporus var. bisporus H97]|uniref:hypothetical protein n=1 Tax=Agaricus bisporus var. bisporus (strain H97 / ATCC MYA-4626 / FGSC 10389) TaxID=936046 RepID=UPI00029F6C1A|nr:hypothetical protein AGABI2DRAFT_175617 [Agaricus bisporus var. bisporus H97]EKV50864.1 hypothetical protein AGABI2DRAFT_175617 [Agaricus bisporus var. bisporus H97]